MAIERSNAPAEFARFEHEGWQAMSVGYEENFAELTRQSATALLDAAQVAEGSVVLDVCCGPGMIAEAATLRGAEVIGLDFSAEAIALASSRVYDATFIEGDAQSLPYEDAFFDAVVCGFGLIHIPDPGKALAEMYRVLKPGGRIALSVWAEPNAHNGFGFIFNALKTLAELEVGLPHGPDFFQFSAPARMKAALLETGFISPLAGIVEQYWQLATPTELVQRILGGSVRARALLLAQCEQASAAIELDVADRVAALQDDSGYFPVPMPALIGTAEKP